MIVADARRLPYADASVHAIVTDPPYGLEFMGKDWDKLGAGFKQPRIGKADGSKFRENRGTPAFTAAGNPTCRNCGGDKYRNGPRKCRCGSPDFGNPAGSQMAAAQRWHLEWAREALRVAKPGAHLVAFGGTRTHHRLMCALEDAGWEIRDCLMWLYGSGFPKSLDVSKAIDAQQITGGRSDSLALADANRKRPGEGRLRSSTTNGHEGFVGSRQERAKVTKDEPLTADAKRWEGWGTALKPAWEPIILARKPLAGTVAANVLEHETGGLNIDGGRVPRAGHPGWPANVVHDGSDEVLVEFPVAPGQIVNAAVGSDRRKTQNAYAEMSRGRNGFPARGDSGSAARFFYCAKAAAHERGEGNDHPTVKPLALMEWLVKLVTPPGGAVLDPFSGSGTTEMACHNLGFRYLGGDNSVPHLLIQRRRLADHRAVKRGEGLPPRKMATIEGPLFSA